MSRINEIKEAQDFWAGEIDQAFSKARDALLAGNPSEAVTWLKRAREAQQRHLKDCVLPLKEEILRGGEAS